MSPTDPFRSFPPALARLPRLIRLYIFNCLVGFALAAVFTGLILWFNVANIGHLVMHVSGGWLAALVFFVLNGIVFAGVQTGIVIMSMDYPGQPKDKGGHRQTSPVRLRLIPGGWWVTEPFGRIRPAGSSLTSHGEPSVLALSDLVTATERFASPALASRPLPVDKERRKLRDEANERDEIRLSEGWGHRVSDFARSRRLRALVRRS